MIRKIGFAWLSFLLSVLWQEGKNEGTREEDSAACQEKRQRNEENWDDRCCSGSGCREGPLPSPSPLCFLLYSCIEKSEWHRLSILLNSIHEYSTISNQRLQIQFSNLLHLSLSLTSSLPRSTVAPMSWSFWVQWVWEQPHLRLETNSLKRENKGEVIRSVVKGWWWRWTIWRRILVSCYVGSWCVELCYNKLCCA